ncbi:MAG: hypothetical protein Q9222_003767 [Ikaeria aurantiellina]
MVECPICGKNVKESLINLHIDAGCELHVSQSGPTSSSQSISTLFRPPPTGSAPVAPSTSEIACQALALQGEEKAITNGDSIVGGKRQFVEQHNDNAVISEENDHGNPAEQPPAKKPKLSTALQSAAPLAERMRPRTLDDIYGQELVGPDGVLRGLIETNRVPSMILWGGPGTGKTTIARVIANTISGRFIEINSTSTGVAECKKLFAGAGNELRLTRRKTIIFCDEIHRFSKNQQDVFLGPVESGQITLIGATTENPSFKLQNALLSRCRTFTLQKLTDADIVSILQRALEVEGPTYSPSSLVNTELIEYLSAFADGDARTALNLLELAMDISTRPAATTESIKSALTKTLVYDRAGDQHCITPFVPPATFSIIPKKLIQYVTDDTISALHKSIRGSDPHASLYYLTRMLASGEDPLYIARRLVVISSEDVGLADSTLLPLATATYTACEKLGMPECRINLAHCVSALALSKKSTRSYRGLRNAEAVMEEPGMAGLSVPLHLRNAPTRLLKEIGAGAGYKYNPGFREGKVKQEYLPEGLKGRVFLEEDDLGNEIDADLEAEESGGEKSDEVG